MLIAGARGDIIGINSRMRGDVIARLRATRRHTPAISKPCAGDSPTRDQHGLCASDRDPRVDSGDGELIIASRPARQPAKALLLDAAIGHSECHSLGSGGMAVSGSDRGAPSNFTHASSLTANLMAAHPWANGRCGPEPRIGDRRRDCGCGRSGDLRYVHRRGSIPGGRSERAPHPIRA